MTTTTTNATYQGNDRLLFGIIMGVIAFWLFAQTTLNIAPDMSRDLGISANTMNIAVAITALFSGIFIIVMGGLADRVGRMKILRIGFYLNIIGSLLVGLTPPGELATPVLLVGRALQGLSAACIMPASLAIVKAYWEGAERQRAISMWSIGSWGGSGLCSLFGGLMSENFGWRSIFFVSIAVCVLGLWMMRGTPESKAETKGTYKFDLPGVLTFMIAMVALQVVVTQGNELGWGSPLSLGLIAVTIIVGAIFLKIEAKSANAFFDFSLFKNSTYTGATISNFLLNAVAGTLIVSLQLVQLGGNMTAQTAGILTLGYAIAIILFIRVGEKLLRSFGARKPMIWGCLITGLAIVLLSPANLLLDDYKIMAVIGYTLFGVGLAFYATPSTDAALANLPAAQAGAGSGIYKMASSLGAAFGVAISAAIFTALSANNESILWLEGVITFAGRQDNLAVREAAIIALGFNVLMIVVAILSIMLTVPKGKKT
ncbi:MFS transporter [Candidimonas sp. SYP-B2681]|uniref:MFS transporter n=1 Tax=Candidimonas sp. SYP-B2681 TaxID=2497686 RepID=UPI000F883535|nr:MFS transporter [Candidimonas sp. SYP-B2681]RTZ47687.1 MFS transporter [Candidimonas sp. SYP-B2681]